MYNKIVNPLTRKKVSIYSEKGINILNNFINQLGGTVPMHINFSEPENWHNSYDNDCILGKPWNSKVNHCNTLYIKLWRRKGERKTRKYKQEGNTHGLYSHIIKHLYQISPDEVKQICINIDDAFKNSEKKNFVNPHLKFINRHREK